MKKYIKHHTEKGEYNHEYIVVEEIYWDYKSLPEDMQEPATRYTLGIDEKDYNDLDYWLKMLKDLDSFHPDYEDDGGWEQWHFEYDFCMFHIKRLTSC
jgi:hypothetical protein